MKPSGIIKRNGKLLYLKTDFKKKNTRLIYERVCAYCGIDFMSNRKTAIYCCTDHRIYAFKKRKRDDESKVYLEGVITDLLKKGKLDTKTAKKFLKSANRTPNDFLKGKS